MALKANGKLIEELRLKRGWNAAQLARRAGLSRFYLSNIERGVRLGSPDARLKIATALGVPVGDITREETPEEAKRRRPKKDDPATGAHRQREPQAA